MLAYPLRQAGFQDIRQVPHLIDASSGTEFYEGFRRDFVIVGKLAQPFMIGMGVTTAEEYNRVYEQMQVEMIADDFRASYSRSMPSAPGHNSRP